MPENDREADRRWAREQIEAFRAELPRYALYAETLRKVLEGAAKQCAPLAIVQTRPKGIASFAEKIQRKKAKYRDPVHQLTDLCGGRVITQIPAEVHAVCDFIKAHFDIDWNNSIDACERLRPAEFGYRSVHYIVKFKPGVFPTREVGVTVPDEVYGLKAEIQVRTILEHSWAAFAHDRVYKGDFTIPDKWQRELAGLAAMLEDADHAFSRVQDGLKAYAANYGAYLTEEQMRAEIEMLDIVLECDPRDAGLADRIARLALALGDWQKVADVLTPFAASGAQPVLRDLGVALCKLHRRDRDGAEYRQGQRYLEAASAPPHRDWDALASLAGTWKGIDDDRARELYRQAFELDPSNPYPLGNYLEQEIAYRRDVSLVGSMKPLIDQAIQRCRDQADVHMNLPWAFYDMGTFHLLLGRPYDSLAAYARAVQLSTNDWMIETTLRTLDNLHDLRDKPAGYDWVRRWLWVACAAKFPKEATLERVRKLASAQCGPIAGPVVIVAGGCDLSEEGQAESYRPLLRDALRGFAGTLVCRATGAGLGGIVGEAQAECGGALRAVGYVPELVPAGAATDCRLGEVRYTQGHGFSPLEPLQMWIDLLASGIQPSQVKVLGANGGTIAAAEYRMALALGAQVGVIEGSSGEAARLCSDDDWKGSATLLRLPADPLTVRAFVGPGGPRLEPDMREVLAQAIHEAYREAQTTRKQSQDPSLARWEALRDYLKESNRGQADDILAKLDSIGCTIEQVEGEVPVLAFTLEEVEILSEMEHGRWNVERLGAGWTLGPRDPARKISPYLVSWKDLPEEIREWDRETVRKIPAFLAEVGLAVRRKA